MKSSKNWEKPPVVQNILEIIKTLVIFIFLTAATQVGGIIYLLYKPISFKVKRHFRSYKSFIIRFSTFSIIYLVISFTIVPLLAQQFNRVPMPLDEKDKIKPGTNLTWLLNRHYVDPILKDILFETAGQLPEDITLVYLDANFPFMDGFPLLPHLSHNDGEKIDLAFIYTDKNGGHLNDTKSFLGYGVVEAPGKNEHNQSAVCEERGYWQYSLLTKFTRQSKDQEYKFDQKSNADLLRKLAGNNLTGKIFIEPHLKSRMGLTNKKFRFHGCQAVRHDDHIHLQL